MSKTFTHEIQATSLIPLCNDMRAGKHLRDAILGIDPPPLGKTRVRKVVTRSRARPTEKYPSWKMGRMVQCESPNELNAYRLLDANPLVQRFYEQPLVIRFRLDGVEHTHFPDTLVVIGNSLELWEIKPASEAGQADCIARTRFMQRALPSKGFVYRVVLAEDLAREPRLSNALTLLKYGRRNTHLGDAEFLRRIVNSTGFICWGSAINGDLGPRGRALLMRQVLEGRMVFDIETALTPSTRFTATTSNIPGN